MANSGPKNLSIQITVLPPNPADLKKTTDAIYTQFRILSSDIHYRFNLLFRSLNIQQLISQVNEAKKLMAGGMTGGVDFKGSAEFEKMTKQIKASSVEIDNLKRKLIELKQVGATQPVEVKKAVSTFIPYSASQSEDIKRKMSQELAWTEELDRKAIAKAKKKQDALDALANRNAQMSGGGPRGAHTDVAGLYNLSESTGVYTRLGSKQRIQEQLRGETQTREELNRLLQDISEKRQKVAETNRSVESQWQDLERKRLDQTIKSNMPRKLYGMLKPGEGEFLARNTTTLNEAFSSVIQDRFGNGAATSKNYGQLIKDTKMLIEATKGFPEARTQLLSYMDSLITKIPPADEQAKRFLKTMQKLHSSTLYGKVLPSVAKQTGISSDILSDYGLSESELKRMGSLYGALRNAQLKGTNISANQAKEIQYLAGKYKEFGEAVKMAGVNLDQFINKQKGAAAGASPYDKLYGKLEGALKHTDAREMQKYWTQLISGDTIKGSGPLQAKGINSGVAAEVMRMKTESPEAFKKMRDLFQSYGVEIDKTHGKMGSFIASTRNFIKFQLEWFAGAGTIFAVIGAFRQLSSVALEFEYTMKNIQAITGESDENISLLAETTKQLATETPVAAIEIAKIGLQLIRAGMSAREASLAMETVTKVVTLTGEDAKTVGNTITTAFFAWGMAMGDSAKNIQKAGEIIAGTLNYSRLQVEDLGEAYNYFGAVAKAFNKSFLETNAILAVFSNLGYRASTIGTGMAQLLSELEAPTKKAREALRTLKIDPEQISGMRKFADVIDVFTKAGLTAGQAMSIFQVRAGRLLLGATVVGGQAFRDMEEKIDKSRQLTEGFSVAMESTKNQWLKFWNIVQRIAIDLGNVFLPVLQKIVQVLGILTDIISHTTHFFTSGATQVFAYALMIWGLVKAYKALNVQMVATQSFISVNAFRNMAKGTIGATEMMTIPLAGAMTKSIAKYASGFLKIFKSPTLWGIAATVLATNVIDRMLGDNKTINEKGKAIDGLSDSTKKLSANFGSIDVNEFQQGLLESVERVKSELGDIDKYYLPSINKQYQEAPEAVMAQLVALRNAEEQMRNLEQKAQDMKDLMADTSTVRGFWSVFSQLGKTAIDEIISKWDKFKKGLAEFITEHAPKTKPVSPDAAPEGMYAFGQFLEQYAPDKKIKTDAAVVAEQIEKQIEAQRESILNIRKIIKESLGFTAKGMGDLFNSALKLPIDQQEGAAYEIVAKESERYFMAQYTKLREASEKANEQRKKDGQTPWSAGEIDKMSADAAMGTTYNYLEQLTNTFKAKQKEWLEIPIKNHRALVGNMQKEQAKELESYTHLQDMKKLKEDHLTESHKANLQNRRELLEQYYSHDIVSVEDYYQRKQEMMKESTKLEVDALESGVEDRTLRNLKALAQAQDVYNLAEKHPALGKDKGSAEYLRADADRYEASRKIEALNNKIIEDYAQTRNKQEELNEALKYQLELMIAQAAIAQATKPYETEKKRLDIIKEIQKVNIDANELAGNWNEVQKLKIEMLETEKELSLNNIDTQIATVDALIKIAGGANEQLERQYDLLLQLRGVTESLANAKIIDEEKMSTLGGQFKKSFEDAIKDINKQFQTMAYDFGKTFTDSMKGATSDLFNEALKGFPENAKIKKQISDINTEKGGVESEMGDVQKQIEYLNKQRELLDNQFKQGHMTDETYYRRLGELNQQLNEMNQKWRDGQSEIRKFNDEIQKSKDGLTGWLSFFNTVFDAIRKQIADLLAGQMMKLLWMLALRIGGAFVGGATEAGASTAPAGMGTAHSGGYILHEGGYVPRYHSGSGKLGSLAFDEVPAILQTRERVLSRDQNVMFEELAAILSDLKRGSRYSQGGSSSSNQPIVVNNYSTNVHAIDSKSFKEVLKKNPAGVIEIMHESGRSNGSFRDLVRSQ